jgi:hypothetical protein
MHSITGHIRRQGEDGATQAETGRQHSTELNIQGVRVKTGSNWLRIRVRFSVDVLCTWEYTSRFQSLTSAEALICYPKGCL